MQTWCVMGAIDLLILKSTVQLYSLPNANGNALALHRPLLLFSPTSGGKRYSFKPPVRQRREVFFHGQREYTYQEGVLPAKGNKTTNICFIN